MIADTPDDEKQKQRTGGRAGRASAEGTPRRLGARKARLQITPPPIAPDLPAPKPSLRLTGLCALLLALAAAAHLMDSPLLITFGIAASAVLLLLSGQQEARAETRFASALQVHLARHRAELEQFSERMWQVQEREERLRGLIDALGDIVVHRDREGRIVSANDVMARLLGQTPETLIGRRLPDFGIDVGLAPDSAFFEDGECLSSTDVAIRDARGTVHWFSWVELSIRDEATGAVSHRAIARDITSRKQAEAAMRGARERAEAANQAKSRFLATVSHEIRTPMNGIIGMAKLLADTRLSAEQRTYVGAVSTSAGALLALIEDLLDYSKIEVGRLVLEPQRMSPRELVENVVELLAPRAYAKDVGLGCAVAPNVPETVSADPGRLRQVLLNVIGNAVKFTEAGGVAVNLSMETGGGSSHMRFDVDDTGPGLRREDRKRIFEEFEQADGTSTRRHAGAGLGLAISKRIIDAMGGTITVEDLPAGGSRFSIRVPAVDPAAAALERMCALRDRRVLVLSRNPVEAAAIARTVGEHGGSCLVVRTVEEAVSAQQADTADAPFDIVLVDAEMEHADGLLLARLRTSGLRMGEAATLIRPDDRGRLTQFRAGGYDRFLVRPVRGESLLRVVLSGFAEAAQHRAPVEAGDDPAPMERASGLSVLVAEDNEINALLARAALEKAGHRVELVGNGRAAVEALSDRSGPERFDLVLMDLHMPVMDGLDAITLIRKEEEAKGLAPVPILVLSADSLETTRHGVLAHGASGFLTKPVDPAAMIEAIELHSDA